MNPKVNSLVLVDRIYRDAATNKFVLAGTFNGILAPKFPWGFPGGASLYIAITDFRGKTKLTVQFKEAASDSVLFQGTTSEIESQDPLEMFEIQLPMPPLPLPKPGNYAFEVHGENGEMLGMLRLRALLRKSPERT